MAVFLSVYIGTEVTISGTIRSLRWIAQQKVDIPININQDESQNS